MKELKTISEYEVHQLAYDYLCQQIRELKALSKSENNPVWTQALDRMEEQRKELDAWLMVSSSEKE